MTAAGGISTYGEKNGRPFNSEVNQLAPRRSRKSAVGTLQERVVRDLGLLMYGTADKIFRVLENWFGNKMAIAMEIIEELQAQPAVKGHQPRKIFNLIQTVGKALYDLGELKNTGPL